MGHQNFGKYKTACTRKHIVLGRATELINDGMLIAANDLLDKAVKQSDNEAVLPYINFWKGEIAYRLNKIDDAIHYYFEYMKSGGSNRRSEFQLMQNIIWDIVF